MRRDLYEQDHEGRTTKLWPAMTPNVNAWDKPHSWRAYILRMSFNLNVQLPPTRFGESWTQIF